MRPSSLLVALLALAWMASACGDDDSASGLLARPSDGDASAGDGDDPESDESGSDEPDSTDVGGDGNDVDSSGGPAAEEPLQVFGSGVLTLTIAGETHDFDVICIVFEGTTLQPENDLEEVPFWSYDLSSPDDLEGFISGHYEVEEGQPGFATLSVEVGDLTVFASEFGDVTTGGTTWSGTFTTVQDASEVQFETSCSS